MQDDHFIDNLPKAELHLHLEGALEPELMFELAGRNGVAIPFTSVEDVRAAYDFANLQAFLDLYYRGLDVLRTEEDFHDLAASYLSRARADGVRHVEPFFDPQSHTRRGVPFSVAIAGFLAALEEAERAHGLGWRLIMCFLRDLSEEEAFATLAEAEPWLDRIAGVGIDSAEIGHPPGKFRGVFAAARERGLHVVAHAGEEGPASYVREAIEVLGAERIDHGVRSLEDEALVEELAERKIPLTVCPLSNVKLRVFDTLADHPFRRMLELGLNASINSDDPSYFGGYVNENYRQTAAALGMSRDEIVAAARNSFRSAFLPEADKARLVGELDSYVAASGAA